MAKCPPIRNATGGFTKDRFVVDLAANIVTCPAGQVAVIIRRADGSGLTRFAPHCATCPLRAACTTSRAGRSVAINEHEAILQHARAEQRDPEWIATYRANRPLVERKIAHLVATGLGWTTRTDTGTATHRHRPRHESGRHQLGASRDPRALLRNERLDARWRLNHKRPPVEGRDPRLQQSRENLLIGRSRLSRKAEVLV